MTYAEQVRVYLQTAGILPFVVPESMSDCHDCLRGRFLMAALAYLKADPRFENFVLSPFHEDIGHPRVEYRSCNGALGESSLHLSINEETGVFSADLDRYDPDDVAHGAAHIFGEVIWPAIKGFFGGRHA